MEKEPSKLGPFAEFKFRDKYPSMMVRSVWGAWAENVWQRYYYSLEDRRILEVIWNPEILNDIIFDSLNNYYDGKQREKTMGEYSGGFAYFCQTIVCVCSVHYLITEQKDNRVTLGQVNEMLNMRGEEDLENHPAEQLLKWGRMIEKGNFEGVLDSILAQELLMNEDSGFEQDSKDAWKRGSIAAFKYARRLSERANVIYKSE